MLLDASARNAFETIIVGVSPAQTLSAVLCLAGRFEDGLCAMEVSIYDEVLLRLARTASVEVRTHLSDRLADLDAGPVRTVSDLALDLEAAVADPVLRRSTLVSERDLITVARTRSEDHLAAVAARPGIGGLVVDGIVARGSWGVLRLLAANPAACLPRSAEPHFVALSAAGDWAAAWIARQPTAMAGTAPGSIRSRDGFGPIERGGTNSKATPDHRSRSLKPAVSPRRSDDRTKQMP